MTKLAAGGIALLAAVALAEIPGSTSTGIPLFRRDVSAIQMLVNNGFTAGATNADGRVVITATSNPLQAIGAAAAQWSGIASALINFLPAQRTALNNNPSDGNFVLTIEDTPENRSVVGSFLAITVYQYASDGTITDSDIIFNPNLVESGVLYPFSTDQETGTYDLQSVMAHELGHTLGSSHSPVIGATMFQGQTGFSAYATAAEATVHQKLSADDVAFATTRYPAPSAQAQLGSIAGKVALTSGGPVPGALVVAVDPTTGITIGGLASLTDGSYQLSSIPPGTYFVYAQPANGPVMTSNLSGVPNISQANANFRVTFAGGNATPSAIPLSAGQAATANMSVDPAAPGMQVAYLGTGSVGGTDWVSSNGVQSSAGGTSLDLLLWGEGLSSGVTASQMRLLGPGITLRSGSLRAGAVMNGMTALRFTVDLAPAAATVPVTIAVVNGTDAAVYSGGFVIVGSATGCTSTVSSKQFSVSAAGGPGTVTVTAGAGCAWTAQSGASWLKFTSATTGSGNGSVSFTADPNTGVARSGGLTIAGQSVIVNQAAYAYTISGQATAFGHRTKRRNDHPERVAERFDDNRRQRQLQPRGACRWRQLHDRTIPQRVHLHPAQLQLQQPERQPDGQFRRRCISTLDAHEDAQRQLHAGTERRDVWCNGVECDWGRPYQWDGNSDGERAVGTHAGFHERNRVELRLECMHAQRCVESRQQLSAYHGDGKRGSQCTVAGDEPGERIRGRFGDGKCQRRNHGDGGDDRLANGGPGNAGERSGDIGNGRSGGVRVRQRYGRGSITSVAVAVDGTTVGNAFYGVIRNDVCTQYPGSPGCPNVGFGFMLNGNTLVVGSHTVTVTATAGNSLGNTATAVAVATINVSSSTTAYYEIVNKNSGKVLDVVGASAANGAGIDQWGYQGGANQQWQLAAIDSTYYRIVNKNSGKVLDVTGVSAANGALIQQWDYVGGANQQWQLVPVDSSGDYEIVGKNSGKVLDVTGVSSANGAGIQQWDYLGGNNQKWQLVAPASNSVPVLTVTKTHTGNFTQGQTNATYTVTVGNGAGAGPTSGTVTVTENAPSGLTLVSMSGTGWSCGSSACTRSDVLNAGGSYPAIAVTVKVASNAPAQVTNQASVSGGGSVTANASDVTTVTAATTIGTPTVVLETPRNGAAVSGMIAVEGYAFASTTGGGSIASVAVAVDGTTVGNAFYGVVRNDVCTQYPGSPGCPNVGFGLMLNGNTLAAGSHIITVTARRATRRGTRPRRWRARRSTFPRAALRTMRS